LYVCKQGERAAHCSLALPSEHEDWTALGIAFAVSTITAFIAVKWLLGYIQSHRFTAFAIYRILFGAALLLMAAQ
jgi:undecaprenyl-diphosphatase